MLLAAQQEDLRRDQGCLEAVATIAAFLSIRDPRVRPEQEVAAADRAHELFRHEAGDFLTALNLFQMYQDAGGSNARARFAKQHYCSPLRMREWADVRHHILRLLRERDKEHRSYQAKGKQHNSQRDQEQESETSKTWPVSAIHRSLLAGLLGQVAHNDPEAKGYRMPGGRLAQLHPSSVLRRKPANQQQNRVERGGQRQKQQLPPWVMAAEFIDTGQCYLRQVAPIDPQWLIDLAGDRLDRRHTQEHFDPERGQVVCREAIRWKGLDVQASRMTAYRHINPERAQEIFIQQALVDQALRINARWWQQNRRLRDQISQLVDRLRQPQIEPSESVFQEFYQQALATSDRCIAGSRDLAGWLKQLKLKAQQRHPLQLGWADLGLAEAYQQAESKWPREVKRGGQRLKVCYRFAPDREDDGVTIVLRQDQVHLLQGSDPCRWFPGLVAEQVRAYLQALPKSERQQLIPFAETSAAIVEEVLEDQTASAISAVLARVLSKRGIQAGQLRYDTLPDHCRLRYRLLNAEGDEQYCGRDPGALQGEDGSLPDPLAAWRLLWDSPPKQGLPR